MSRLAEVVIQELHRCELDSGTLEQASRAVRSLDFRADNDEERCKNERLLNMRWRNLLVETIQATLKENSQWKRILCGHVNDLMKSANGEDGYPENPIEKG